MHVRRTLSCAALILVGTSLSWAAKESAAQRRASNAYKARLQRDWDRKTQEYEAKVIAAEMSLARRDPVRMYPFVVQKRFGYLDNKMVPFAKTRTGNEVWLTVYSYTVLQVLDERMLLLNVSKYDKITNRPGTRRTVKPVAAVLSDTSAYVDGQAFAFTNMLEVGRFQYVNVEDARVTVRKYQRFQPITSGEFVGYIRAHPDEFRTLLDEYKEDVRKRLKANRYSFP